MSPTRVRQGCRVMPAAASDAESIRDLLLNSGSDFDVQVELARAHARLWVVRVGSPNAGTEFRAEVLGGVLLAWDVADEVHVIDLVVGHAYRRRGLGRALLQAVVQHARLRLARVVWLEVRKTNIPALGLYRTQGFSEAGERKAYYSDGEDAVQMRLDLEAP